MNILSSIKFRNTSILVSVITILTLSASGLFAFSQSGSAKANLTTLNFTPVVNSYVNQSSPTNNWGTSSTLYVDGSPLVRSYLRFNVTGVTTGTVSKITLRIYANSKSTAGLSVNKVADTTWQETTINYNNAPTLGSTLGSSAAVSATGWVVVDITSALQANGLLSLAVLTTGSTAINMSSRESGGNAPQLVVETSSGSKSHADPNQHSAPGYLYTNQPPASDGYRCAAYHLTNQHPNSDRHIACPDFDLHGDIPTGVPHPGSFLLPLVPQVVEPTGL